MIGLGGSAPCLFERGLPLAEHNRAFAPLELAVCERLRGIMHLRDFVEAEFDDHLAVRDVPIALVIEDHPFTIMIDCEKMSGPSLRRIGQLGTPSQRR